MGEQAAVREQERQKGKDRKLQNEFKGEEPGHLCIKKKKRKTDAVSYYKPHPLRKCPHMQSVL